MRQQNIVQYMIIADHITQMRIMLNIYFLILIIIDEAKTFLISSKLEDKAIGRKMNQDMKETYKDYAKNVNICFIWINIKKELCWIQVQI